MLKRLISPFSRLLIRGCVSPKKAAASACVHRRASMYCRKSSSKSALTFRFAASSASNPTSSNTLSLPGVTCVPLASWPCFAMLLDRSITLPANLDVVLGRLLRFLLERVEYINCPLELGDIENTIGIVSMNANFVDAGTDGGNRFEVGRVLFPVGLLSTLSQPCRRASRGKRRTSSRDEPIHTMGLSSMPHMPNQVYQGLSSLSKRNCENRKAKSRLREFGSLKRSKGFAVVVSLCWRICK
jgi:hypothetical protein